MGFTYFGGLKRKVLFLPKCQGCVSVTAKKRIVVSGFTPKANVSINLPTPQVSTFLTGSVGSGGHPGAHSTLPSRRLFGIEQARKETEFTWRLPHQPQQLSLHMKFNAVHAHAGCWHGSLLCIYILYIYYIYIFKSFHWIAAEEGWEQAADHQKPWWCHIPHGGSS